MVELLFVACLAGGVEDCRERSLVFTDVSPMMCMMGAQPELAKWVAGHPNYTIQSWKCRGVVLGEKKV
ncbi:hypothetical protein [Tropicibacter sp. S64]|uniref:hypothetical protein n=1 Tax=Tropicibacter sp. S64 TaxID=3415122 RepID=UPI003C7E550B